MSSSGTPVYHTNIVMGIGQKFAVLCKDSIVGEETQKMVLEKLSEDRDVIVLTEA